MSQKYASSNPPTTIRPAANRDLYRQRKPHAATRSPVSDIAVQNRFDGKSTESNTSDRNRMQATTAIASGRIRARCLRLERSRRISIAVADAKQKRGMLVRTSATFIALIGRRPIEYKPSLNVPCTRMPFKCLVSRVTGEVNSNGRYPR